MDSLQQAKSRMGIVGNAPSLLKAIDRALRVAPIDLSVLVTGESGSGKEFFPQIIHAWSPRKHARYIAVNCGAIPEGTIDSELFGHEKGAFTGALATRKGYFEEADGGTIFLDEVAELPLTTQARLLRVLESGEFMKVGSSVVQKTNIRIVAATNVDMEQAVREGRFREDLFYRLSTVQIQVPPLRERGNDIMLLARKFSADFSERYRTDIVGFDDDARALMLRYRWPGNVRQLKNAVEQISLFESGHTITREMLLKYLPQISDTYSPIRAADAQPLHSYAVEREMLFGIILRLQNEISELKEQVVSLRQTGSHLRPEPQQSQSMIPVHVPHPSSDISPIVKSDAPGYPMADEPVDVSYRTVEQPVVPLPAVDPSLSLVDNERETIRRALERTQGKRKAAAAELQISERTLYRKIKEYNLDDSK